MTRRPARSSPTLTLLLAIVTAAGCMAGVPAASSVAPTVPSVASATPVPTPSAWASASVAPVAASPAATQRVAATTSAAVPAFGRIYVIVMENKEYGSIVGSANAPYLNGLIRRYGLATRYYGVTHPSQPNYIAFFSGSTQGVRDNLNHNLGAKNLADQIEAHHRTWRVFAENVPLGCYKRATASGGEDGAGTYTRKHEPAISFTDISGSARRCGYISNLRHFSPTAANFELIIPNMCHDMHDCSVRTGDNFLSRFVPRITGSSAFANSVLFITWDEGSTALNGGGRVATLVISPRVRAGTRSATVHNHYSLLRTIENAWGLGCLGKSCTANDLREFFQ